MTVDEPAGTPPAADPAAPANPQPGQPVQPAQPPGNGAPPPDPAADLYGREPEPEPRPEGGEGDDTLDAGAGEDDGEAITSWDDLVEHSGWDREWAESLEIPVKVDGVAGKATLKDLVASYQMGEAATKRLTEAKTKADAIRDEATRAGQAVQQQLAVANRLVEMAEQQLADDSKAINWAKLREDDPGEYAAKKEEMQARRQRLDQMKADARTEFTKAVEDAQAQTIEQRKAALAAQHEQLLTKVPEWSDPARAKAEKGKVAEYLMAEGFTREQIAAETDHRLIVMARKAMLYDEMAGDGAAKKRVTKVPKVIKPGAGKADAPKQRPTDAASILYGTKH